MMIDTAVNAGQSLLHVQPGGGGYGNPFEREAHRVLDDVLDEKISVELARKAYGVVIDERSLRVDEQATASRRSERLA